MIQSNQNEDDERWMYCRGGPRVPLLHQFPMLCDENRVDGFAKAIANVVKPGDIVLDLGAGSGIFSLLASKVAHKVYAIEIDPMVLVECNRICQRYADNIKVIHGDACHLRDLPEVVDVVICEMVDTALLCEHIVPAINNILKNDLMKKSGKIIPMRSQTMAQLAYKDFSFYNYEIKLSHFEGFGSKKSITSLSEETIFHDVVFNEIQPIKVGKSIQIKILEPGIVNCVRIVTYIYATPEILIPPSKDPNTWLNPPIVVPIDDIQVSKGDVLSLFLSYEMGAGWETLKCSIEVE